MSERRVLRIGRELDPFLRKTHGLVQIAPLIEVELREVEIPFGEGRVHLDRLLEGFPLALSIAQPLVEPPQVELRLVALRMPRDLLPVFAYRSLEIALLLGHEREVVVREPHVLFLRDRRADLALGAGAVAPLERDDAERVARRGELRLNLEGMPQLGVRIVELPVVDQDLRGLVTNLGIL